MKHRSWCQFSDRIAVRSWFPGLVIANLCLFAAFIRPDVARSAETAATETTPPAHGSIATAAAWDGRIVVDGMVTVEAGATLVIKAGTEVRFAAAGGITVNGALRAEGAADKPILFLPAADGQETWAGVALNNASSPSLLRSCRIARAVGITIGPGEHR